MFFQDGTPIKKSDRLITNLDPPAVVEEPATPETNPLEEEEEEPENEPNGDAPSAPEGDFYNHRGAICLQISVHKICAGASAGAGKVRVRVRRG